MQCSKWVTTCLYSCPSLQICLALCFFETFYKVSIYNLHGTYVLSILIIVVCVSESCIQLLYNLLIIYLHTTFLHLYLVTAFCIRLKIHKKCATRATPLPFQMNTQNAQFPKCENFNKNFNLARFFLRSFFLMSAHFALPHLSWYITLRESRKRALKKKQVPKFFVIELEVFSNCDFAYNSRSRIEGAVELWQQQ